MGFSDRKESMVALVEDHVSGHYLVVLECQVWPAALGRARGEDFSVAELKQFTGQRGCIRDVERPGEVTKRDVLLREWETAAETQPMPAADVPNTGQPTTS